MTPIKYAGQTASENFVHALACTLAPLAASSHVKEAIAGPRTGQHFFTTPYSGLARLVGNALKPTTLKALVNRHPALALDGSHVPTLTVYLPSGHEAAALGWGG